MPPRPRPPPRSPGRSPSRGTTASTRDQGRAQEHRVHLRDPDRIAAGPRRPGGRLDAGQEEDEKTDDNGFFTQWSKQATDKGVKAIDGTEDNLAQTVAGSNPDLIIVAKTGQDSAAKVVESLRQLEVPVLVIDYGSHSWQDVTKTLGQATGRQAKADAVVKDYTTKAEKAKSAISVPKGATSVFTVPGDGTKGANAFTEEAPQAQLLKDLGFTIAAVPDSVKGDQSMGDRKDIVQLSPENVQAGLTGENWVVIAADETAKNAVTSNETFSSAAR